MNYKLFRVHRTLAVAYMAFIVIFALLGIIAAINHGEWQVGFIGLGVLPIAVVHWCAAKGARLGKRWGRLTSRVIGIVLLVGFPIGTAIGVYILSQTGKKWQAEGKATATAG
jgi:hypothetical protein